MARVNVILRRVATAGAHRTVEPDELIHGRLRLDPQQHLACFAETPLTLTALEFSILRTLMTRATVVFSREQIMTAAYQLNIQVSDRTIDSHIRNIRAKLASAGCEDAIETVHGVGFRLGRCGAP